MQNTYIKELAKKSFQEEPQKEYDSSSKRGFHPPSFLVGLIVSLLLSFII